MSLRNLNDPRPSHQDRKCQFHVRAGTHWTVPLYQGYSHVQVSWGRGVHDVPTSGTGRNKQTSAEADAGVGIGCCELGESMVSSTWIHLIVTCFYWDGMIWDIASFDLSQLCLIDLSENHA